VLGKQARTAQHQRTTSEFDSAASSLSSSRTCDSGQARCGVSLIATSTLTLAGIASDLAYGNKRKVPHFMRLLGRASHRVPCRTQNLFRSGLSIASAVPLDDARGAWAIPRDMGVHYIGRPRIRNVGDFVPSLGFACAQANRVAALQIINATPKARGQHGAEQYPKTPFST
jgi:hypothetical protein